MKNLILIGAHLMLATTLMSCDAEKRVAKVLDKHPEVFESATDTLRTYGQVIDSTVITENGKTFTWYSVRDTVYETVVHKVVVNPANIKTKQEKRLESKERRQQVKEDAKTDRVEAKQSGKTDRQEIRTARKSSTSSLIYTWLLRILLLAILAILIRVAWKTFISRR